MLPQELTQSIILSSQQQNWQGLEVTQFKNSLHQLSIPPKPCHAILLHLGTRSQTVATIGDLKYLGSLYSGCVTIIPAYTESNWRWQKSQPSDVLLLRLDASFVEKVAIANHLDLEQIEFKAVCGYSDPQIKHIGLTLKAELESGCRGGSLFAESLSTALAVHLLKHYLKQRSTAQRSDRPFEASSTRLQQVVEYIDEYALEDLRLADLVQLSGLSQSYFTQQFKKLTGLSPYQYVLQCRVERAKQLLQQKEMAIADVALKSGFKDQNHLTKTFRRFTGMTPKVFQQYN